MDGECAAADQPWHCRSLSWDRWLRPALPLPSLHPLHIPWSQYTILPILSYVVSTLGDSSNDYVSSVDNECTTPILAALCHSNFHPCIVITWAFLVQIATINTTPVLAINPREGRNVGPSLELLVKVIWTFYLAASISRSRFLNAIFRVLHGKDRTPSSSVSICAKIMFAPFVLICAKIVCKYFAFEKARLSFELGRNPALVFGYMKQLE